LLRNRELVAAVALTVVLQVLLVVVPVARDVLDLQPLDAGHRLLVVAIALAYLLVVELDKAAYPAPDVVDARAGGRGLSSGHVCGS
jgi:hypothetical protein